MKKIKLFIILISILLLTGCDFTYDLKITKNGIIEKNTAYFEQGELVNENIKETVKEISSKYFINDDHLIANETNIITDKNGYQTVNNYALDEINNLKSLNLCYDNIEVISNKSNIGIKTSSTFNCFNYYDELENVTIHISSSFKCIECNADEVIDGDYYWYLNRNDYDKEIIAVFSQGKLDDRLQFAIICTIILFVGTIITLVIFQKQKKVNKI